VNYLICGFSGAGKSTLIRDYSKLNQSLVCLDLDQEVLATTNFSSIGDYIQNVGFVIFREKELAVLTKLISSHQNLLLALGGGTLTPETLDLINTSGQVLIWLATDFETCWERIQDDPNRPLVAQGKDEMFRLYQERLNFYQQSQVLIKDINELMKVLEKQS